MDRVYRRDGIYTPKDDANCREIYLTGPELNEQSIDSDVLQFYALPPYQRCSLSNMAPLCHDFQFPQENKQSQLIRSVLAQVDAS